MNLIPDDIDLGAYMRAGEDFRPLVRPATDFRGALHTVFGRREPGSRKPEMFSTKLRNVLEFRPGEVTVWAGYNGHRKSMFTGQVALDLVAQRQRVLIASFEMDAGRTLARMARQAWVTPDPTPAQLDAFLDWAGPYLSFFDHVGTIKPDRCTAVCRYFCEELKGQHVFIDSMMMVCASEERLDEQKQFMTGLVRLAIETGLHVHLVAHCRKPQTGNEERPPTKYDLRGSAAISDQAHNVVIIWANKAKKTRPDDGAVDMNAPDVLVTVEKQRNGEYEGRSKMWFDERTMRFCDSALSQIQPYAGLE